MEFDGVQANPLSWPFNWKRTKYPTNARFNTTFAVARDKLLRELELIGASKIIISSNLELRKDGLPYAQQRNVEDSGVAVYFVLNNKEQCIPCDKWRTPADNIQAIRKTVEALRGLERWGAKEMVNVAFKGFQALPMPEGYEDYFGHCAGQIEVEETYKTLRKRLHPDMGGSTNAFQEMMRQYKEIKDKQ